MKRLLRRGRQRFEIELGLAHRRDDGLLGMEDRLRTVALLRSLAVDPANREQLRRVLGDSPFGGERRADDAAVIEQIATLLVSGRAVLREGPLTPPLSGFGGPAEAPAETTPSDPTTRRPLTWIEIELIGEDDSPVPGEAYQITLPDGSVYEGQLDAKGFARVDGIDPGTCQVTFPSLDLEAWKRI